MIWYSWWFQHDIYNVICSSVHHNSKFVHLVIVIQPNLGMLTDPACCKTFPMCLAQQDPAIPSAPPHLSPLIHDCYTPFSFISLWASLRAQSICMYVSADENLNQCSECNEATSDKLSKSYACRSFGCSGTFFGQLVSFSAKLHWVTSHK